MCLKGYQVDGVCRTLRLCYGNAVAGVVLMVVLLLAAIPQLFIGALSVGECPVQSGIPFVLLAGGCLDITIALLRLAQVLLGLREAGDGDGEARPGGGSWLSVLEGFAVAVLAGWLVTGSVLVYGSLPHVQFSDHLAAGERQTYCSATTFHVALHVVSLAWGAVAMLAAAVTATTAFYCCMSKDMYQEFQRADN